MAERATRGIEADVDDAESTRPEQETDAEKGHDEGDRPPLERVRQERRDDDDDADQRDGSEEGVHRAPILLGAPC
jgi:hypothetical protein